MDGMKDNEAGVGKTTISENKKTEASFVCFQDPHLGHGRLPDGRPSKTMKQALVKVQSMETESTCHP